MHAFPCALTVAGSDSSGGAGIQADLKTFAALGVYGASVITALTAQNTVGVRAIQEAPPAMVAAQLDAVLEDLPIGAVKIGMLASAEIIAAVADRLRGHRPPHIVLDPVMVAKSGDALLRESAAQALIADLLPLATLITPNLPEAARLLGVEVIEDRVAAARALREMGARAVLLKGAHAEGAEIADVLVTEDAAPLVFRHPRQETPNTHGTGCSLSSAIAAELAKGRPLPDAVGTAIDWLQGAIAHAWPLGAGHGPVHHFWELWTKQP